MTIESPNPPGYITDLDDSYPASGDSRTEGDDHIRNIKTAIRGSFANFTGAAVTSTEAELNVLDGITSSTSELNILDGVTANASELNRMDGITPTTAELNIVDGSTGASSITIVDADQFIINDNGTMRQIAASRLKTYLGSSDATNFGGTVNSSGTILSTYGETWGSSRRSEGVYRITPGTGVSDVDDWIVAVSPDRPSGNDPVHWIRTRATSYFEIKIVTRGAGNNFDCGFTFQVRVGS